MADKPIPNGHRFQKGQSGNPGGREKTRVTVMIDGEPVEMTIGEMARAHSVDAINVLLDIASDKQRPAAARVSAAVALLDRGWGKPAQMVTGDPENPVMVGTVTLADVLAARSRVVDEC